MIVRSPEVLNRIAEWRAKEAAGTLTIEDMRQAIIVMRENRMGAQTAASESKSRSRAKGPSKSAEAMLDELDNL
jgi:hypothetical protein